MSKAVSGATAKKTFFAMAVHCHQPVYNFGWEIERAYKNAYAPLVEKLIDYPEVKMTFHFSGGLIKWFSENRPGYISKLKELYQRGQIEFLGGGCYDPLLPLLPERDRIGQIKMNSDVLFSVLGAQSRGIWLAERLWEPSLIDTFSALGVEYCIVDDQHITTAGIPRERLDRPYRVFSETASITLFPALTEFRYSIPFRSAKETFSFIERESEKSSVDSCFFFADDGEKFGAWPHTHRHVYLNGWIDSFFSGLTDRAGQLETQTYSDLLSYAEDFPGTVPDSSYPEMLKWSGGAFGNFAEKYTESARMYKRMISVSDKLELSKRRPDLLSSGSKALERSTEELYKAQAGCAYWHGVFAGVYQPHLRKGVYEHLIKAEHGLKGLDPAESIFRPVKVKENGPAGEISVDAKYVKLCLDPAGGVVTELDHLNRSLNLANVITRRWEQYHDNLNISFLWRINRARKAFKKGQRPDINELLGASERGLKKHLVYDQHRRSCFVTHIVRDGFDWDGFSRSAQGETDFLSGKYDRDIREDGTAVEVSFSKKGVIYPESGVPTELEVKKQLRLAGHSSLIGFGHKISVLSERRSPFTWAVEFNLSVRDEKLAKGPLVRNAEELEIKDSWSGSEIKCSFNDVFTVYTYPVHTVNQTEKGLARTYQGLAVLIGSRWDKNTCDEMELDLTFLVR